MRYVAMRLTEKALEKFPKLLENFGLSRDAVFGKYMVRGLDDTFTIYTILDSDRFDNTYVWTHREVPEDWADVEPIFIDPTKVNDLYEEGKTMTMQAMYFNEFVLNKHPYVLEQYGLRKEDVLSKYMVVNISDGHRWFFLYDVDTFQSIYRFVNEERIAAWRNVVLNEGFPTGAFTSPSNPVITRLKVTHMSDVWTEMLFEVPDDCPETVKFVGVSLIQMTRLLKSCDPGTVFQEDMYWRWELELNCGSERTSARVETET